MDQTKIGRFIAECRKANGFTQLQLADHLGITDKAVSKWERGLTLPDTSIMLALCELLKISVNELLCGEKNVMKNENQANEQLLLDMAKELEKKNKTIWRNMWIILFVSMAAMFCGIALVAWLMPEGIWQTLAAIGLVVLFLIPCLYALKLEISVGVYACENCGHEFVPSYFKALWAMHMGTTRYMKCPKCNQRTWCKKILKR